jgi:phage terminase large subunit-like protein
MMQPRSDAETFALRSPEQRQAEFRKYPANHWYAYEHEWKHWRRSDQAEPEGAWRVWLVMAGRGFGKTRMGAEWIRGLAENNAGLRIAIVGATAAEVRSVMVEGECGLLAVAPTGMRPTFEPSLKRLTWKNGTIAELYSAAEPDGLRGGQHDYAWADEIAKWDKGEAAWDNLMLGLRRGAHPRVVATTTPRPVPLIRRLVKEAGVVRRGGATRDNISNLSASFITTMNDTYGGSRLGRQELEGELIDAVEGALWQRSWIDGGRVLRAPDLVRVVVGVDPPASATGDACGIIAVGLGKDGRAYVLGDHSASGLSPQGWAQAVATAAARWSADKVIAEKNNGGDMVESVLRGADVHMPVRLVHAAHGKVTRAEPVASLYEGGKIAHAGAFPELEDELCGFVTGGYEGPGRSPDRADALVWAVTELMLGKGRMEPRIRGF